MQLGISKQELNELIQKGYEEKEESIFDQKIYDGQRPTIGSKQLNRFFEMPKKTYKSKITLQVNTGKIKQVLYKPKQDTRKRINNTLQYPYCSIGLLSMEYENQQATGSGALVAGNYILTCAHNIYDRQSKKQAEKIVFYPACNGKRTFGLGKKVIRRFIMEEYKTCEQQEAFMFDYAILEIQNDISKQFGYFGIEFTKSSYKIKQVTVCGYPGDKEGSQQKTMWSAKGQIKQIQKGQLYYDIPTYAGQSGSPIFIYQNKNYYIVGIHTHGDNQKKMNGGKFIQNVLHNNFKKWTIKKAGFLKLCNQCNIQDYGGIGSYGMKHLASRELPRLKQLNLGNNGIGSQGIRWLVFQQLPGLKQLNIGNNGVGAQGIRWLVSREWPGLSQLNLDSNGIGAYGIRLLVSQEWPVLKQLNLGNNGIGASGIKQLASREWPVLNQLNLVNNGISQRQQKQFKQKMEKLAPQLLIQF